MSLFDDITSQISNPALLMHHGGTLALLRVGVPTGDNVEGIFIPGEPRMDTQRGREVVREGTVIVSSSLGLDPKDRWRINGETWECLAPGTVDAGFRHVPVKIIDPEIVSKGRAVT